MDPMFAFWIGAVDLRSLGVMHQQANIVRSLLRYTYSHKSMYFQSYGVRATVKVLLLFIIDWYAMWQCDCFNLWWIRSRDWESGDFVYWRRYQDISVVAMWYVLDYVCISVLMWLTYSRNCSVLQRVPCPSPLWLSCNNDLITMLSKLLFVIVFKYHSMAVDTHSCIATAAYTHFFSW